MGGWVKFRAQNSPSWIRCSLSSGLRCITPTPSHKHTGKVLRWPTRRQAPPPVTESKTSVSSGLFLWDTLTFSRLRSRFCRSLSFWMLMTILCLAPLVTFCGRKDSRVKLSQRWFKITPSCRRGRHQYKNTAFNRHTTDMQICTSSQGLD